MTTRAVLARIGLAFFVGTAVGCGGGTAPVMDGGAADASPPGDADAACDTSAACSNGQPPPDAAGTPGLDASLTCNTTADCPSDELCGFAVSQACSATGSCFTPRECGCGVTSTVACGCEGANTTIDPECCFGLPNGYQLRRILHAGPCVDGG